MTQPPVMQHWIIALKHISIPVYGLLAFASEAFWEMEMFGNMRYIPHRHLMCVAWTMLISHWFFFASGIGSVVYEYVIGSFETKQPKPTSSKVDKTKPSRFNCLSATWSSIRKHVKFDAEVEEFSDVAKAYFSSLSITAAQQAAMESLRNRVLTRKMSSFRLVRIAPLVATTPAAQSSPTFKFSGTGTSSGGDLEAMVTTVVSTE